MDDPPHDIGCAECIDLLADYVDEVLPETQAKSLERHIENCPPCVAFVNTYKGTVGAARRLRQTKLPAELRDRLVAFLQRPNAQPTDAL